MFKLTTFLVAFTIVGLYAASAYGSVHVLDDSNFDAFLKDHPISIIKFYAPWCGHCKKLAPLWEEFGDSNPEGFAVAKVDCTVAKDVCSGQGVRGYPTIKIFVDGTGSAHNGARTVDAFTSSVKAAAGGRI
ncbi:MAG: protein disulfide isomerase family protein [archaeon]|nr:protein disulfide isomerase family protein [archaeon]